MNLNYQDVKEILAILDASPFDEMKLETEGLKLTLRRTACGEMKAVDNPAPERAPPESTTPAEAVVTTGQVSATGAATELIDIKAPMLGIFYSAPKPGAAPFVKVGQQLQEQTVVCIIEVMKLMNSVQAKVAGKVVEVCVKDGELVEFDQVLFRVSA